MNQSPNATKDHNEDSDVAMMDRLFLDIIPNHRGVRMAPLDNSVYLSAIDIVSGVCGYTAQEASHLLTELRSHVEYGDVVSKLLSRTHQFPGERQRATPMVTFEEAMILIGYLPKKYTVKIMKKVVNFFTRFMAGDATLFKEIAHNALSDGVLQTFARSAIGIDKKTNAQKLMEDPVLGKRKLMLDMDKEQNKNLKMKCDQEERIMNMKLQSIKDEMEMFKTLCGGKLEEHDRLMFMERFRRLHEHEKKEKKPTPPKTKKNPEQQEPEQQESEPEPEPKQQEPEPEPEQPKQYDPEQQSHNILVKQFLTYICTTFQGDQFSRYYYSTKATELKDKYIDWLKGNHPQMLTVQVTDKSFSTTLDKLVFRCEKSVIPTHDTVKTHGIVRYRRGGRAMYMVNIDTLKNKF
jgi:hypothetical protein